MTQMSAAWIPWIGSATVVAGLLVLVLPVLRPARRSARAQLLADRDPHGGRSTPRDVVERVVRGMQRLMDERRLGRRIDQRLEAAGLHVRPAEYVLGVVLATVTVALLGAALAGPPLAVLLGMGALVAVRSATTAMVQRRQNAIARQLPDTLQVLASSLRSGYGMLRSIDMLTDQAPEPTAEEFRRLLVELRLGRDLDTALRAMASRIGLPDLEWVVQALEIHRDVGGDLAEVLDTVRHTVMQREEVRGQIRALTAQGRLSARILIALPFGVAAFLLVTRPRYMAELTSEPLGWAMIAFGAALMAVGITWIHRLTRLVF